MTYTIKVVVYPPPQELVDFLACETPRINGLFGDRYDLTKTDLEKIFKNYMCLYCTRDDEVTGILISYLGSSPFDESVKILRQVIFYVKEESGRTAYHLFKKFIDIGRLQANYIITTLASQTNIKPSTLERLGFNKLETLYRLEVDGE